MGAPTSAVLAEVYIKYMQNEELHQIWSKHPLSAYFRYFGVILKNLNEKITNIEGTVAESSEKHKIPIEKNNTTSLIFCLLQCTVKDQV
jgi:hypothetical protein